MANLEPPPQGDFGKASCGGNCSQMHQKWVVH